MAVLVWVFFFFYFPLRRPGSMQKSPIILPCAGTKLCLFALQTEAVSFWMWTEVLKIAALYYFYNGKVFQVIIPVSRPK